MNPSWTPLKRGGFSTCGRVESWNLHGVELFPPILSATASAGCGGFGYQN